MDCSTKVKESEFGNSFTTSYFGKALMRYTLITQQGEVSGLVRILHQRLWYHMTIVMYIYIPLCASYLYIVCIVIVNLLIPPLHWFNTTPNCTLYVLSLHVPFSSNLDTDIWVSQKQLQLPRHPLEVVCPESGSGFSERLTASIQIRSAAARWLQPIFLLHGAFT